MTFTAPRAAGPAAVRTGWAATVAVAVFLLLDSVTKLISVPAVVAACAELGFPAGTVPVIGAVLLGCLALHLVPRTALLGAVLLTGYLGGAVAAQLRIEAPLFSALLFPVYVGVAMWVGYYLRSSVLRELVAHS